LQICEWFITLTSLTRRLWFDNKTSKVFPFMCVGSARCWLSPSSENESTKSLSILLKLWIVPSFIGQATELRLRSPVMKIF
jgi:hypothetical protein